MSKVIVAGEDRFLREKLANVCSEVGLKVVKTADLDRLMQEAKKPGRVIIIDVNWPEVQKNGALRQLVNISRITDNSVICMCPNQEEDLKMLARFSRAQRVFIRYEIATAFKEFVQQLMQPNKLKMA